MSVIAFSFIVVVVGIFLMEKLVGGYAISMYVLYALVGLAGIVVNDSLIMIDLVNRQRREGTPMRQAVIEAGARRFRPILLTSATTFLGLIPMILERSLQAKFLIPMAVSLGFGVLFATAITLVLVPCVYLILEDLRRPFTRR